MLSCHETIANEDASFPMLVAALFAEAFGGDLEQLHHATDDIASAYRQLRCAHPEYSVVAIWDTELRAVRYYTMYGHNFGRAGSGFGRLGKVLVAGALHGAGTTDSTLI